MNDNAPSTYVQMSIEIEIPNDLPEEYQDVIADDLSCEANVEHLSKLIKKWARLVAGVACHISVEVE
jgi:hypothetical protein